MKLAILFIVVVTVYKIGHLHGFCECEAVVQDTLNRLMEEVKEMEVHKTGRGRWEKQENEQSTDDGLRKKKKS